MQQIEVKVENDHIERVTTAKPLAAISELVWNSYDADANAVIVEISEGPLTKLGSIRVKDDGRAGLACLDSSPRILSGSLPGFAERGAFRFCRGGGRA
ncbi:ATP-binding protein [Methylocystis iwaonis]|uniref:ATP-binding protein n=1 Tax=Methylocystis iwaonis TaxID=2885079 RepID=UPI003313C614